MKVFVMGSIAFDRIGRYAGRFADAIRPEQIEHLSVSFIMQGQKSFLGGCAGNIAYSLALMGVSASIVGLLGRDGEDYKEQMQNWGMDVNFVELLDGVTANAFMLTDNDNNQIAAFAPGVMEPGEAPEFVLPTEAEAGDVFLLGPENHDRMIQAAEQVKAKGLRLLLDLGQLIHTFNKEELLELIELGDGLFVNEYEWGLVQSISGLSEEDIREALAEVYLTKAERGAVLFMGENELSVESLKVELKDPTGAGDAFRAGVLAAKMQELPAEAGLRAAVMLGANCVCQEQTQGHGFSAEQVAELKSLGFDGVKASI